jgi:hypothetical protein
MEFLCMNCSGNFKDEVKSPPPPNMIFGRERINSENLICVKPDGSEKRFLVGFAAQKGLN